MSCLQFLSAEYIHLQLFFSHWASESLKPGIMIGAPIKSPFIAPILERFLVGPLNFPHDAERSDSTPEHRG